MRPRVKTLIFHSPSSSILLRKAERIHSTHLGTEALRVLAPYVLSLTSKLGSLAPPWLAIFFVAPQASGPRNGDETALAAPWVVRSGKVGCIAVAQAVGGDLFEPTVDDHLAQGHLHTTPVQRRANCCKECLRLFDDDNVGPA